MTTLGVWAPQGVVIPTLGGSDSPQQPTVLFEGNAQILSGNVFKCWFANEENGLCYAEATAANGTWTRYSGGTNGLVLAGAFYPKIFKNVNTGIYYLYCNASGVFPPTHIDVYSSMNFGITWTLAKANAIVTGLSGAWDSVGVGQLQVFGPVVGVYYGYYFGTNNPSQPFTYPTGLATSTDLVNWTKISVNAPVIPKTTGNFTFAQVGNVYYGWSQILLVDIQGGSGAIPSDISRFSATNPAGPWTQLSTPTIYRTTSIEGVASVIGQVADPCIVFDGINTWMFVSADNAGGSSSGEQIEVFLAANTTIAQLVQTYEGVQNYPIPDGLILQLNSLASQTFTGHANVNPIGGNWTPIVSGDTAQILSGMVTSSTAGTQGDSYWSALTWAADQWSQIVVGNYAVGSFLGASVRMNTSGVNTQYRFVWHATSGSTGTWILQKIISGTFTTLALTGSANTATGTLTVNVGDKLTLCIIGTELSAYWNGMLVATATDSSISSGSAGFEVDAVTSTANVGISSWSGGNFQNAPPTPPIGNSGGIPWYLSEMSQFDAPKRHKGF